MMKRLIIATILLVYFGSPCIGAEIWRDSFDGYANIEAVDVMWAAVGGKISLIEGAEAYGGSGKCLLWTYDSQGTAPYELTRLITQETSDLYVQFKFKIEERGQSEPRGGIKFLKMFGVVGGDSNYANCTMNLGDVSDTYPSIHSVHYGPGTGTANDTQVAVFLFTPGYAGEDPYAIYTMQTERFYPTQGHWHTTELRCKYNTDGNRDGEFAVWVDGELRMRATNIKNRHDDNTPIWDHLSLGDYGNAYADMLFYVDDVIVSDTYIEFDEGEDPPDPPSGTATIRASGTVNWH